MYGYSMGGFGYLWMIIAAALLVVPFWRLLPKVGVPNWVAVFAIFPLFALILLWVVAFKDDLGGGKS